MEDNIECRTLVFVYTDIAAFAILHRYFEFSREKYLREYEIAMKGSKFICSKGYLTHFLPVSITEHYVIMNSGENTDRITRLLIRYSRNMHHLAGTIQRTISEKRNVLFPLS